MPLTPVECLCSNIHTFFGISYPMSSLWNFFQPPILCSFTAQCIFQKCSVLSLCPCVSRNELPLPCFHLLLTKIFSPTLLLFDAPLAAEWAPGIMWMGSHVLGGSHLYWDG